MEFRHYTMKTLAPGVYGAIAREDGMALCNAGIIDLGAGTLLFDTAATLGAARELRAAAEALTGRAPDYVINSHVHPDHTNGNCIFSDEAALIAAAGARDAIVAEGQRRMENFRRQLEAAMPAEDNSGFQAIYPTPADLRIPELAFEQRLSFAGTRNTAELIALGGHTGSDAVLWLPAVSILFVADLITDGDVILRDGNAQVWLNTLDRFAELAPGTIVPGHGEVADGAPAIERVRAYIQSLLALTAGGGDEDWVLRVPLPAGCDEHWFRDNLRTLTCKK